MLPDMVQTSQLQTTIRRYHLLWLLWRQHTQRPGRRRK
jgi:hypothetical protein